MILEVPQHIRQRLAGVINDLKSAIGQMTNSQTEADPCCLASSPQVANPVSLGKGTAAALCESCRGSKKHRKRGTSPVLQL